MKKKIFDYSLDADKETLRQFKECYSEKFVTAAALMPDAHKGYVAPIGAVLVTKAYVVPAWVGFDIGCGMIAVRIKGKDILEKVKKNIEAIYNKVVREIPMGVGETNKEKKITLKTRGEFVKLLDKFSKGAHDKRVLQLLKDISLKHLGTLGGGNHFISLNEEENQKNKDFVWLVIHSGSRGMGHRIAKEYMIRASHTGISSNFFPKNRKASGDEKEYEKTFPLDVKSQLGKEYLNVLDFGLEFALLNRLEMSYKVVKVLEEVLGEKLKAELWTNKNHNHAIPEKGKYIHRKGATPAKKGERGIIPGNMRDGSFLVEGLGNPKFLYSSTHGAGRAMSRKKAKEVISKEEFKEEMKGIKTNLVIDEAPMAYKDIFKVMEKQKSSVKIIKHLKPIINWQK